MPLYAVPDGSDAELCRQLGLDPPTLRSREHIDVKVLNNSEDVSLLVAREISDLIRAKAASGIA
jgi:hypothetical protein